MTAIDPIHEINKTLARCRGDHQGRAARLATGCDGGGTGESACKRERKRVTNGNSILTTTKNMSRQDDAALTGQGMGETPRADKARAEYVNHICKVVPIEVARQLERELNQAINERDAARSYKQVMKRENDRLRHVESKLMKERDKAQSALAHLIKLHEREIETRQPIIGEEWEIAGYAVADENKHS
jgi:hypothetical protein